MAHACEHQKLVEYFTHAYSQCLGLMRLPGSIAMPGFADHPLKIPADIKSVCNAPFVIDSPLVVRKPRLGKHAVLKKLDVGNNRVLLMNFGGFQLESNFEADFIPPDWIVITFSELPLKNSRLITLDPKEWYIPDIIQACDVVLGKCGYGVCSETLALGVPLIYIKRPNFVEEAGLLSLIQGNAIEMPISDFRSGNWKSYIVKACNLTTPKVNCNGDVFITEFISKICVYNRN